MSTAKPERPVRPDKPVKPQRPAPVEPAPPREKKAKRKSRSGPTNFSWLWNPFSVGLIGSLVGSLFTVAIMTMLTKETAESESRLHQETLQHRNNLAGMEGINRIGGSVIRDMTRPASEKNSLYFIEARMSGVRERSDLRLAVNYASILPGIKRLSFQDSVADNTVMRDIRNNFQKLDSLNISGTKVTELETIKGLGLTELNLDRTPIDYYELRTIADFSSVRSLTLGPPAFEIDGKTPYQYTTETREQLLADLISLQSLSELTVYNFSLDAATRNTLRDNGVEVYERKR